jgi:hypothetical protein
MDSRPVTHPSVYFVPNGVTKGPIVLPPDPLQHSCFEASVLVGRDCLVVRFCKKMTAYMTSM